MTDNHWSLAASLVLVLEPLKISTTALCVKNTVTSLIIQPITSDLMENNLKVADNEAPIRDFKITVSQDLDQSFAEDAGKLSGWVCTSFCDPRYKKLNYGSTTVKNVLTKIEN